MIKYVIFSIIVIFVILFICNLAYISKFTDNELIKLSSSLRTNKPRDTEMNRKSAELFLNKKYEESVRIGEEWYFADNTELKLGEFKELAMQWHREAFIARGQGNIELATRKTNDILELGNRFALHPSMSHTCICFAFFKIALSDKCNELNINKYNCQYILEIGLRAQCEEIIATHKELLSTATIWERLNPVNRKALHWESECYIEQIKALKENREPKNIELEEKFLNKIFKVTLPASPSMGVYEPELFKMMQ